MIQRAVSDGIQAKRPAAACRFRWLRQALAAAALCFLFFESCPPVLAQRQLFHAYGAAEGLRNLNVRCLFQDQTGYIWVGTDNGLFRYDGGKFTGFGHEQGLFDTEVLSLAQSSDGRIWVGTNSGLAILTGNTLTTVPIGEKSIVSAIQFDVNGTMYLQREDGVLEGKADSSGVYHFHLIVRGIVTGLSLTADTVFFGKDGDLWRLRGETAEQFGVAAGLPHDEWGGITADTNGDLWVRSRTRLYEMPKRQARFVERSDGIPRSSDMHVYADRHGTIFIPTIASIIAIAAGHRTTIDSHHGLPADPSGPMLIDREDLLWVGTDGAGLVRRLGHGEWSSWNKDDGLLRNSVWAIKTDDRGQVWVGNNGGLTMLDAHGDPIHQWTSRNGLPGDRVLSIVDGPADDVYAGTDAGAISRFNRQGLLLKTYQPRDSSRFVSVNAMALDAQHRIWVATSNGCFRTQPLAGNQAARFERLTVPGLTEQTIYRDVLVNDDQTIWFATSRGLLHYDRGRWTIFTEKDGLRSANLGVVAKAETGLWIAYRDALGLSNLSWHGARLSVKDVTTSEGLHSDAVYAIATDHKARLWVTTDSGVDVLEGSRWKHLGSENGLIWNDTDSLALHVDAADAVWIGTSGGLSRYTQPEFTAFEWSAPIVLTSVASASKTWQAGDEPTLSYADRSLVLDYAVLSYEAGSGRRFHYRLQGHQQDWTETTERSVEYAALPPGQYTFEVTYALENGSWSSVPARFSFSISPPWWRSWWFITSAVLVSVLITSGFVRIRLRRLESQKAALELQVADRTAELLTSHRQLEEIAYFDMLTGTPNRRMFVEEFLRRSSKPQPFALMLIDLDFFKHINDTFGHDAGDTVLVSTALRLRDEIRETDFVARMGGDEFAILLSSSIGRDDVERLCRRILNHVTAPIQHKGMSLQVGCSIGLARFPVDAESQEGLYKLADVALYQAKQNSRNTFCWHHSIVPEGQSAVPVM